MGFTHCLRLKRVKKSHELDLNQRHKVLEGSKLNGQIAASGCGKERAVGMEVLESSKLNEQIATLVKPRMSLVKAEAAH